MDHPVSKAPKLYYVETDICVDRISDLPSDIIGNILSLIPMKEAVATSVLSPKWKWVWTFITRFNFNDQSSEEFQKPSFISFIYRALYRKTTSLDYFSVSCYEMNQISHFRDWVSAARLLDVKELDLHINVEDATRVLPFELFSCKNLVNLILRGCFKIDVPATVCLPSLVSLTCVEFRDKDSLKRLLIGCPALEELNFLPFPKSYHHFLPQEVFSFKKLAKLQLANCWLTKVPNSLVIFPSLEALDLHRVIFPDDDSAKRLLCGCPSLQKLDLGTWHSKNLHVAAPILSNMTVCTWVVASARSKMVLETPSLRYLKFHSTVAGSFESPDLNQVVEADLRMYFSRVHKGVTNLLMGLSNVKTLHLGGYGIQAIVKSGCELPKFHNLTTLKLGVSKAVGWAVLPDLLEHFPFLETLVFENGVMKYGRRSSENAAALQAPRKVPHCLVHHLKVIQINRVEGDIEEEEMIQYFIENRGALKDLTIQYSPGSGKFWDMN